MGLDPAPRAEKAETQAKDVCGHSSLTPITQAATVGVLCVRILVLDIRALSAGFAAQLYKSAHPRYCTLTCL